MLNHIDLMGRLTDAPQRRESGEGQGLVTFSIACQHNHVDKDGSYGTDFFDIVTFGKTAEFAEKHFRKGQLVAIEGRLAQRQWKDADGNKRRQINIVADRLHFAGSKQKDPENDKPGARVLEPGGDIPYAMNDYYDLADEYVPSFQ